MDANHFLQIFLAVTGFILTSTLLLLAYFIKKWIESVDTLAKTVQALEKTVVEQKAIHTGFNKNTEAKIEELQEQISDNTHRIEQNSVDIVKLQTKKGRS
jgi:TolA-binding protein